MRIFWNKIFSYAFIFALSFIFATPAYSSQTASSVKGLSRKILSKNIEKGVNTLTQAMVNNDNTIYVVQHDFVLGSNITLPANCVLSFEGGSISAKDKNNTLIGQGTIIESSPVKIFDDNVTLSGKWNIDEPYSEWFGVSLNIDATATINKALLAFNKVVLLPNKTYIVNGTINLFGKKCLRIGNNTTILKDANNGDPVISITGGENSLLGESKQSVIKSNYPTPYGLVSVCDYKETIWKATTFYNKIDNITLRGPEKHSNTQSIGLRFKHVYREKGLLYAAYYNSFTNLWFEYFNIGIHFKGDVNGNIIRDAVFTYCGTGDFDTDAGITFESSVYEPDKVPCACQENEVANIIVTNAWEQGGAACLCLKGRIHYNTFIIHGENGPSGYGIKVVGDQNEILHNNFITEFVQFLGDANADKLYKTNVWLDGRGVSTPFLRATKIASDEIEGGIVLNKNSFYKDSYFNYSGKIGTMIEGNSYSIFSYSFVNSTNVREIIKYKLSIYTPNGYCNGVIDASVVIEKGSVIYYDAPIIKGIQIQKPVIKDNKVYIIVKPDDITGRQTTNAVAYLSVEIVSGRAETKNILTAIHLPEVDSKGYLEPYKGATERAYVVKSGTSVQRPTYPIDGMYFFDTSLQMPRPIWYNDSDWYEFDGVKVGVKRNGSFANKPNGADIPLGFEYYCTDRKTPEGGSNGIVIYHRGNNVWVDALGRVVR